MDLKKAISERGWTLERLAAQMVNTRKEGNPKGISQSSVWQIINGNPTIDKLQEIASIIGISLEELVSDNESKINGYVEVKGTVYKVTSAADLKRLVELAESKE